jgi:hypothetical protein
MGQSLTGQVLNLMRLKNDVPVNSKSENTEKCIPEKTHGWITGRTHQQANGRPGHGSERGYDNQENTILFKLRPRLF